MLELLPYNWEWKGISQVYHNVTTTVGDIHHFAWRAKHPRWAQYVDENEARYAHWTAEECSSRSPAASPTLLTLSSLLHKQLCCINSCCRLGMMGVGGEPPASSSCYMCFCLHEHVCCNELVPSIQHAALLLPHGTLYCSTVVHVCVNPI